MSFHVINTTLTFCWSLNATDETLVKADFDIIVHKPDGTSTYTNDGLTTFVAPTPTSNGEATFDILVDQLGRYQVTLSIGASDDYLVKALREVYIVDPPAFVTVGTPAKTTRGPEIIPPIPVTPPDLDGYVNIAYVHTTRDTDYAGGVTCVLKAGAAAQAVPADWIGYTGEANIADALDLCELNGDYLDFGIHFPEMPDIPKYGTPLIWDRSQNMTIEGTSPDKMGFDPLDEYGGAGHLGYAWGCFLYLWNHGGATPTIAVFGGEAGYNALTQGDNPEWDNKQWIINDDVYIKLSTD